MKRMKPRYGWITVVRRTGEPTDGWFGARHYTSLGIFKTKKACVASYTWQPGVTLKKFWRPAKIVIREFVYRTNRKRVIK